MLTNKLMGKTGEEKTYIEDVFSTYLYTGNGVGQTITNGIQLGDGFTITPGTELGGGYFAGFISTTSNSAATHALIVAPKSTGESVNQWKTTTNVSTGAESEIDGPANTAAINTSVHPAAQFCTGLTIGGYTDWYLPAKNELEVCYFNLKPSTSANSTASGINTNSVPRRYTEYTESVPSQTLSSLFITGGSEAFETNNYWTSTASGVSTTASSATFYNGQQADTLSYSASVRVRAIRRIPVSDAVLDPYRTSGKGGLVWIKDRTNTNNNVLTDTARGTSSQLYADLTNAAGVFNNAVSGFTSSGFNLSGRSYVNGSAANFASWTFRKAPKFFDVVTYTGDGASSRQISHSLGQAPGMVIVKCTNTTSDWAVWHRGDGTTWRTNLNLNGTNSSGWSSTIYPHTSTTFSLDQVKSVGYGDTNISGNSYVAYLFAHDTTTDGLIQCGSFTTDASGNCNVTLGWEPQYVLVKPTSASGYPWVVLDNMRGFAYTGEKYLLANTSGAEADAPSGQLIPNATGFSGGAYVNASSATHIYMAIRRGPMRTPTDATKVFSPIAINSLGSITTGFALDMQLAAQSSGNTKNFAAMDRLRGVSSVGDTNTKPRLVTSSTAAEDTGVNYTSNNWNNTGFNIPGFYEYQNSVFYNFQRAPGFFDVVCYTGTGAARTVNHNLGVAPELMIFKSRTNTSYGWITWHSGIPITSYVRLNTTDVAADLSAFPTWWLNNTYPTKSVISLGESVTPNDSGQNYVAYLFASCPGVSKVGTFTSNNTDQLIDCGFTNGARFVMIKATSTTGDWMVFDTARGIVAGNDAMLKLNSTSAESSADYVDPYSAGFGVTSALGNGIDYIYLAIA